MKWASIAAALAVALFSSATYAGSIVLVDLSGIVSWDEVGDTDNIVLTLQFAPGARVTGVGWDVNITPVGTSWYSEATAGFTDSGGEGIDLRPGILDGMAGSGAPLGYSSGGIIDFDSMGLPDIVLADGILIIEFFETFDDFADEVDANWSGTLSVQVVPLPAAVWLMASALLGLAGWRRQRG